LNTTGSRGGVMTLSGSLHRSRRLPEPCRQRPPAPTPLVYGASVAVASCPRGSAGAPGSPTPFGDPPCLSVAQASGATRPISRRKQIPRVSPQGLPGRAACVGSGTTRRAELPPRAGSQANDPCGANRDSPRSTDHSQGRSPPPPPPPPPPRQGSKPLCASSTRGHT